MYIYISRSSALYSYYLSLEINISVSSCSASFEELMIVKYRLHSKNIDLAHECFTTNQFYLKVVDIHYMLCLNCTLIHVCIMPMSGLPFMQLVKSKSL